VGSAVRLTHEPSPATFGVHQGVRFGIERRPATSAPWPEAEDPAASLPRPSARGPVPAAPAGWLGRRDADDGQPLRRADAPRMPPLGSTRKSGVVPASSRRAESAAVKVTVATRPSRPLLPAANTGTLAS
jgi:hypothetical protein